MADKIIYNYIYCG